MSLRVPKKNKKIKNECRTFSTRSTYLFCDRHYYLGRLSERYRIHLECRLDVHRDKFLRGI